MTKTVFLGTGHYVPEKVVTNDDLAKLFDTSDEWIRQRTGIETRHHVDFENDPMGASELGARAARLALADAKVSAGEVDLIINATLSPEKVFPGDGVLVQAKLDIPPGVPALDVRDQCSGFLYGLAVADAFIRCGTYRRVLLIGSEVQSSGLDFSDEGRDVAVLFGDGAGAVVLGPSADEGRGLLSVRLHADGRYASELEVVEPSGTAMPRLSTTRVANGRGHFPRMNGRTVFKHASSRMPEVVREALAAVGMQLRDLSLLIPHQANLRISEMLQKKLELDDAQMFNNIQRYGNTTAASIPIAIDEARHLGRLSDGDLLCLTAFGSGFTWGAALVRW